MRRWLLCAVFLFSLAVLLATFSMAQTSHPCDSTYGTSFTITATQFAKIKWCRPATMVIDGAIVNVDGVDLQPITATKQTPSPNAAGEVQWQVILLTTLSKANHTVFLRDYNINTLTGVRQETTTPAGPFALGVVDPPPAPPTGPPTRVNIT